MSTPVESDETIFAGVLACSPSERAAFLDEACANDRARRERIEMLVRAHAEAKSSSMAIATCPS